ncbi:MAG: ABC transporter ATP-binding protein [Desulfurococcaceae archaeon]|nr:ABC transporter ATP-binding protein [Desulfurococcaceae archaeon]
MSEVLRVENLRMYYRTMSGLVRAVEDVNFRLREGETIALIGESGCGKTSLARAVIRFLPRNVAELSGSVVIDGIETIGMSDKDFDSKIRWRKITYVSQAAISSLNPVIRVVDHMIEPLVIHFKVPKTDAIERAKEIIKRVGIPEDFLWRYPFELSGGMRQRVVIAISLITNPKIVILDEPTSALDVMTQANILNMLKELRSKINLSYIFITHDIAVSSELADKVAVMYAGWIVELGPAEKVYVDPLHPYSKGLLGSVPRLRSDVPVTFIPGTPPSLINPPKGCRFRPRCRYAMPKCEEIPPVIKTGSEEYVRCWLYGEK